MASGRSYDINNYPLDEHGNGIGERDRERGYEDHNESYLTYYSRKCWTTLEGLKLICNYTTLSWLKMQLNETVRRMSVRVTACLPQQV